MSSWRMSARARVWPARCRAVSRDRRNPPISLHADKTVAVDEIVQMMNTPKDNGYGLIAATQP